jgi:rSAM/selenodomain-associated transferase 1
VTTTVIVFAKAPLPGLAKTRLIPALGTEGAAALAARMLRHTLAQAVAAGLGPVELCATPDAGHPLLRAAAASCGATLAVQGTGDLGDRMHRALARHLAEPGRALLIGTDAPALDATVLRQAAQALADHDAVFVPALDGGYALVGLRRADARCFAGMTWSHARVMADARDRLRAAGLRWAELAPVADIDEPADLLHLPPGWRPACAAAEPTEPAAAPPAAAPGATR